MTAIAWLMPLGVGAQDVAQGRRVFLEKADCQYCHGWARDGAGAGQSPGGAANLRRSQLDRATLITVISCGVPGTAMPHFDENAYTDKRCYGMTEAEIGDRMPALPPACDIRRRENCERVVAETRKRFGAVHMLVNNAGRGPRPLEESPQTKSLKFWESDPAIWCDIIDTNVNGTFLMARSVAPH